MKDRLNPETGIPPSRRGGAADAAASQIGHCDPVLEFNGATAIVFMKAGVHNSEALEAIIERKSRERDGPSGLMFWGYGNSLCDPLKQVQPFAAEWAAMTQPPLVVMPLTTSRHQGTGESAEEISADRQNWQPVPAGVRITGSTKALVLSSLRKAKIRLDFSAYEVAIGPKTGRRLSEHLRARTDKACAIRVRDPHPVEPQEELIGRLAAPYAVYVR